MQKQKIQDSINNLIKEYEEELPYLKIDTSKYDVSKLPSVMQGMVRFSILQSPSFSNIAATAISTFVLSSLFGQLRVKINDTIYSEQMLGVNSYTILISRSGSGKDRTFRSLQEVCSKAFDYIEMLQKEELEEKAKNKFIRMMKKDNPKFDETKVIPEDYADLIEPLEAKFVTLGSSRAGLVSSLNRLHNQSYGNKNVFASELGMSIQSSPYVLEIIELLSGLYDMGEMSMNEYKTAESKEKAIKSQYMNFMGISAPAPFYIKDSVVTKQLVPMIKTALARRSVIIFSKANEEFENEIIPTTLKEKRELQAKNRVEAKEISEKLSKHLLKAVKRAKDNNVIAMDDEASQIYEDYKGYTELLGKKELLNDPESVNGTQLLGIAFKMLRIAAVWSFAQNRALIDKETILAAIHYVNHAAEHLTRFMSTLELKDYELFATDWLQGFFPDNQISIDRAITRGYITTKQTSKQAINAFLKPVNARLRGEATVTYDEVNNLFVFTPLKKNTETEGGYKYNYKIARNAEDGLKVVKDKQVTVFNKLLSGDCRFNVFAEDTTNVIAITANEAIIEAKLLHKLLDKQHFIGQTAEGKQLILLPINNAVNKQEYKYICMSIAQQLLMRVLPEEHEAEHVINIKESTEVLSKTDGDLFDVSGILAAYATNADIPKLATLVDKKPAKYLEKEILDNKDLIVDIYNASDMSKLFMAGLIYDMKMHKVEDSKIIEVVTDINNLVEHSIPQEELIDVFSPSNIVV